jgi:hypothetical protein
MFVAREDLQALLFALFTARYVDQRAIKKELPDSKLSQECERRIRKYGKLIQELQHTLGQA